MQQKINPGVAIVIILIVIGIAGYALWYPNRPRPIPTHFGPMTPGQGMALMHGGGAPPAAPMPGGAGAKPKAGGPKDHKAKDAKSKDAKAKDEKAADAKPSDAKPTDEKAATDKAGGN